MLNKLDEIKQQAIEELGNITDKADLEALRVAKLGKKGAGLAKRRLSLNLRGDDGKHHDGTAADFAGRKLFS